jgi:hypothetical protein
MWGQGTTGRGAGSLIREGTPCVDEGHSTRRELGALLAACCYGSCDFARGLTGGARASRWWHRGCERQAAQKRQAASGARPGGKSRWRGGRAAGPAACGRSPSARLSRWGQGGRDLPAGAESRPRRCPGNIGAGGRRGCSCAVPGATARRAPLASTRAKKTAQEHPLWPPAPHQCQCDPVRCDYFFVKSVFGIITCAPIVPSTSCVMRTSHAALTSMYASSLLNPFSVTRSSIA